MLVDIFEHYQKTAQKKIPKITAAASSDSESEDEVPVKNGKAANVKPAVANGNGKKHASESSEEESSDEDTPAAVKAAPVKASPKVVPAKKQESSDSSSEEEAPKATPVSSASLLSLTTK